jgi:hypothetical protein
VQFDSLKLVQIELNDTASPAPIVADFSLINLHEVESRATENAVQSEILDKRAFIAVVPFGAVEMLKHYRTDALSANKVYRR